MAKAFNEDKFLNKCGYKPDTDKYQIYKALTQVLKRNQAKWRRRVVVITDVEQDYDDLLVMVLAYLHGLGVVELVGFVANYRGAKQRASFLHTILHLMDVGDIPVAVDTEGVADTAKEWKPLYYELYNETFAKQLWNETPFEHTINLMNRLIVQTDRHDTPRLSMLCLSSLQDASEFLNGLIADPKWERGRLGILVSQGGYDVADNNIDTVTAWNNATNNSFHMPAAEKYTTILTKECLSSDAWTKNVAGLAALDTKTIRDLYRPIGTHLL